jgi:internalin A
VDEIRSAIAIEAGAMLPAEGELLSERWIRVRDALRDRQDLYIPYAQFVLICTEYGITDPDEADAVLELLHTRGQLLHYASDPSLRDVVVLQPEWLTNAVSRILDDPLTRRDGGILDHARLGKLWQQRPDGQPYTDRARAYLLRLMEVFDISYRLEGQQASLIPQLLPVSPPTLPWSHATSPGLGERVLALILRLTEPAPGLVPLLLARNHYAATDIHWRNGALLADPIGGQALLSLTGPKQLALTIRGPEPIGFFWALFASIEQLLAHRWKDLAYQAFVPCPTSIRTDRRCAGTFPLAKLRQLRGQNIQSLRCRICKVDQDVMELLTGFPTAPVTSRTVEGKLGPREQQRSDEQVIIPAKQPLTQDMDADVLRKLDLIIHMTRRTDEATQRIHHALDQHTGQHDDAAMQLRAVLRAFQTDHEEHTGCPRLFTGLLTDPWVWLCASGQIWA